MNYYPYDSFEVDVETRKVKRKIRCKTQYLDVDKNANWVPKRAGELWDWRSSLANKEIAQIGDFTYAIREHVQSPVEVMYFLGVHPSTGHPSCPPWYYTTEALPEAAPEGTDARFAGTRVNIRTIGDLEELEQEAHRVSAGRFAIRLLPIPELIRSTEFVERVSEVARKSGASVELEGSFLSHVFYILSRKGIRVRCLEPFEGKTKRRFGKLVRDRIPLRIESRGEVVRTLEASPSELLSLLKVKVLEEGFELFWETDNDKVFEESVDLLEVLEALVRLLGRSPARLRAAAKAKRQERGGFEKGIVLVETEEVPLVGRGSPVSLFENEAAHESIRGERRPRGGELWRRADTVQLPMIPPPPVETRWQRILQFEGYGVEIVLTYERKKLVLTLRPLSRPDLDRNQLRLF